MPTAPVQPAAPTVQLPFASPSLVAGAAGLEALVKAARLPAPPFRWGSLLNWLGLLLLLFELVQLFALPLKDAKFGTDLKAFPHVMFLEFARAPGLPKPSVNLTTVGTALGFSLVAQLLLVFSFQFLRELWQFEYLKRLSAEERAARQLPEPADYFFYSVAGSVIYGHGKPKHTDKLVKSQISLLADASFLIVCNKMLSLLACSYSSDLAHPVLLIDPTVQCWTGSHKYQAGMALVSLMFYVPLSVMIAPTLVADDSSKDTNFSKLYLMVTSLLKVSMLMFSVFAFASPLGRQLSTLFGMVVMFGTTLWWTLTSLSDVRKEPSPHVFLSIQKMLGFLTGILASIAVLTGTRNGPLKLQLVLPLVFCGGGVFLGLCKWFSRRYSRHRDKVQAREIARLRGAKRAQGPGFVVVYSITDRESLKEAASHIDKLTEARDLFSSYMPAVLVGNKCDLAAEHRQVSAADFSTYIKCHNHNLMRSFETSAKLDINVKEAFFEAISTVAEPMGIDNEGKLVWSAQLRVIGNGGVGKSSLVIRFLYEQFISEYDPTIEDTFIRTVVLPDGRLVRVEVIDTAGQEEFCQNGGIDYGKPEPRGVRKKGGGGRRTAMPAKWKSAVQLESLPTRPSLSTPSSAGVAGVGAGAGAGAGASTSAGADAGRQISTAELRPAQSQMQPHSPASLPPSPSPSPSQPPAPPPPVLRHQLKSAMLMEDSDESAAQEDDLDDTAMQKATILAKGDQPMPISHMDARDVQKLQQSSVALAQREAEEADQKRRRDAKAAEKAEKAAAKAEKKRKRKEQMDQIFANMESTFNTLGKALLFFMPARELVRGRSLVLGYVLPWLVSTVIMPVFLPPLMVILLLPSLFVLLVLRTKTIERDTVKFVARAKVLAQETKAKSALRFGALFLTSLPLVLVAAVWPLLLCIVILPAVPRSRQEAVAQTLIGLQLAGVTAFQILGTIRAAKTNAELKKLLEPPSSAAAEALPTSTDLDKLYATDFPGATFL